MEFEVVRNICGDVLNRDLICNASLVQSVKNAVLKLNNSFIKNSFTNSNVAIFNFTNTVTSCKDKITLKTLLLLIGSFTQYNVSYLLELVNMSKEKIIS